MPETSRRESLDREWSQEELRAYLIGNGFPPECLSGVIPQGAKFISFSPLTEGDIRRAEDLVAAHRWVQGSMDSQGKKP